MLWHGMFQLTWTRTEMRSRLLAAHTKTLLGMFSLWEARYWPS